jgi:Domain of unknown function (DUF4907)
MRFFIVIWIGLFGASALPLLGQPNAKLMSPAKAGPEAEKATPHLQYFVIKSGAGTFGYDIYSNGNLYIHQPTIPSQPGGRGFADTAQAGKVARLAMNKIRKGQMPPTIVPEELHELGIPVSGRQKP